MNARELREERAATHAVGPSTGETLVEESTNIQCEFGYNEGYNVQLRSIFTEVTASGDFNYKVARRRVPSGLSIPAWKEYLKDYSDGHIVQYLEYGWPINFNRDYPLMSTHVNHASARDHGADISHYIATELGHGALAGPFGGPPVSTFHVSPLMTRPKRDSVHKRVIMDLSWPRGAAINDGVVADIYVDGPATIHLPTADYMVDRLLQLGSGAYLYKTDLARGYRQLRVDPSDWPLLGFQHEGKYFMDLCPPFGLRTSAMFMQRTSEAICYIHAGHGFHSRPYLDDFGGAEATKVRADDALRTLQGIMGELGIVEAEHKVCPPSQSMIWLGIHYDSLAMIMSIPPAKLQEVREVVGEWVGKTRATKRDIQCLFGLLQFVASVSPPARTFTNRILADLREAPDRGSESLSLGFRQDVRFFADLWPHYNGVRILQKRDVVCQEQLELDACLGGCGAYIGDQFYSEVFPSDVLQMEHPIARLELLNIVVALKVWGRDWAGTRVRVFCDNTNAVLAVQSGRSRDGYVQHCIREIFQWCTRFDIEMHATHRPGSQMGRADALSRASSDEQVRELVAKDTGLAAAKRVRVQPGLFRLSSLL